MSSTVSVGISIGSESCAVAVCVGGGRTDVVANESGERTTPTYAAIVAGELLFGQSAKNALIRYPMQTVPYLLPMSSSDVVNSNRFRVSCETDVRGAEEKVVFPSLDADDEEACHDAFSLLTQFLSRFKAAAVDGPCGGSAPSSVVLAVPRYMELEPLTSVLEGAGFASKMQVMHADVAAALAYPAVVPRTTCEAAARGAGCTMVVDWGANTLCVSLLGSDGGLVEYLMHRTSFTAGGAVIDKEIQQYAAQCFQKKTKLDPRDSARSMRKLLAAAEEKKKALSSAVTTSLEIEAFCEGMDLKEPISRVKLESIIREKDLCGQFDRLVEEVLEDFSESENAKVQITHVVLSGGSLRIPLLVQHVKGTVTRLSQGDKWKQCFDASVGILEAIATDEVSAVGACSQATALAGKAGKPQNDNVNSHTATQSIHALSVPLLLYTGQPSGLKLVEGKLSVARSDVSVVVAQGSPLPMDSIIELGAATTAATPLLLLAPLPGPQTSDAINVALLSRTKVIIPVGTTKVTLIVAESGAGGATIHVVVEDAAAKQTHLTKSSPLEVTPAE